MKLKLQLDDSRFRRALANYSQYSRKSGAALLRQQAKFFVRDVVRITPPSQGKLSKARGEAAVRGDLSRILRASRRAGAEEAADIHSRLRRRDGRVDRRYNPIPARNVAAYKKQVLARVGLLASGWNAAAVALGLTMPPWISRHGSGYGTIKFALGASRLVIAISNRVRYVGNVSGLGRRIQAVLDNRAAQLRKQTDYFLANGARKAGFR